MLILQLLLNGIALGAAYALAALGFVLVLNATRAVNFAQGDMVMAGGFLAVALGAWLPLPGIVLLPAVLALMAALGLVVSLVAYLPLKDRPPTSIFISTIAVGVILQQGANDLFGAAPQAGPPLVGSGFVALGGLVLSRQALATILVAALLVGGLHLLLTRTQTGRRLRAAAQDPEMARAIGVDVTVMSMASFALAAALAGAAGLLLANQYFVTPGAGSDLMLKAYIAVVIGGWGRLGGAVIGALLIALFEVGVAAAVSYPVAEALLYTALLVVLLLRPEGLLGEAEGRRA
jgi:branched-chain amino acid transport system permease protein